MKVEFHRDLAVFSIKDLEKKQKIDLRSLELKQGDFVEINFKVTINHTANLRFVLDGIDYQLKVRKI